MDADRRIDEVRRQDKEVLKLKLKLALSEQARERIENHLDKHNNLFKAKIKELNATNAALEKQTMERNLAMDSLRDSEEKYRILLDESSDPTFSFYPNGQYRYVNRAFAITVGKKPEEIIGKKIRDIFPKEEADKRFANVKWVCENGKSKTTEVCVPRPDGDRYFLTTANPVLDDQGRVISVIASSKDITGLKLVEIELRHAKEQAESATKLKDKFVEMVAHDLRSPFTSMMGLLKLLAGRIPSIEDAENQKILNRIFKSGDRMISTIDDLLKVTRFKTGQIALQPRFFKAEMAILAAIHALELYAAQKGVRIINEVPPDKRLYADPSLFGEVLLNLLSNAIKFCSSGDKITFFTPPGLPSAIAVRDTGKGISEKMTPDLFRHEVTTTTPGAAGECGTGLGLPFSQDVMKAHGGELTAESAPGKGSVFCAIVPFVKPMALIVDDDDSALTVLREHLERIGVDVIEASTGDEALAAMRDNRPHIILTDILMPGMDGYELLNKLKQDSETSGIPVIVMTASGGEARERALTLGADDFMGKPIEVADFIPRVRRFVG